MRADELLTTAELGLRLRRLPERRLGFAEAGLPHSDWVPAARERLTELLALPDRVEHRDGALVRTVRRDGIRTDVLRLEPEPGLSLPGYLLTPEDRLDPSGRIVLALHGHGEVESLLGVDGVAEDYHHRFAHRLALAGHTVFVPELRGFGALYDLAADEPGTTLRYWRWGTPMAYTVQTDAFLHGRSMLGDTVADLMRWESWLAEAYGVTELDVVGISWGGDLACTYPVFSNRVRSIFASGTLGSFTEVFRTAGNAPAHCLPGVLRWLDRSDIAGLNAPVPLAVHYGALDVPGPTNLSAALNDSALPAFDELRAIYAAAGAPEPTLIISPNLGHELDLEALTRWLDRG
ncbi:alpha/beta fold hydrolase [Microlunatus parietis]|uniref:Dienelactone hydrolase n=1 Tax=Microlunatus parietis TaxID=682979 RepID=A0A7Y9LCC0_9ACTN|nr:alpha/beta fold hydrolase [Microlunatus parietis]NYE71550.1 dienelactone hydrolase [Microlunatus parietis]